MISVIIPVYNTEKYLARCLESALKQTYKNIEIICVNDGSDDNSLDILNEYKNKDERVKVINQEKQGVSVARNNAISKSKGEYLFFLDSDDFLEPNCLETLYKASKITNSDITYGAYNSYKNSKLEYCNLDNIEKNSDCEYFGTNIIIIGGKLYKKSFLISNNITFPPDIKMGEDSYFNYMCFFKNAKFKAVKRVLYNYQNLRENSATSNYLNCSDYDVFRKITESEIFKNTSDENKKIYLCTFMYSQIYWFYQLKQDYKIHKLIKDLYKYLLQNFSKDILRDCKSFKKFKYIAKLGYKPKTSIREFVSLESFKNFIKHYMFFGKIIKNINFKKNMNFELKAILKPKISVVIPVYNTEKYLKKCLDSLLNQTFEDIEIICVNDGSDDNSLNILNEYKEKDYRITVINQKNSGAGSARNEGIKCSEGEYIYFLDSDDWLKEDAFEKLYIIAQDNKANVVKFKSYLYDDVSGKLKTSDYVDVNWVNKNCFNSFITIENNCVDIVNLPDSPWSGFYNLKFIKDNKIFFDNLKCANDVGFFYRCIIKAKKVYLSDIRIVYYRICRKNSLVTLRAKNFNCQTALYDIVKKESAHLEKKYRKIFINQIINATFYWFEKCKDEYQTDEEVQKKIYAEMNKFLDKIPYRKLFKTNKTFYNKYRKRLFGIEMNRDISCIIITLFKKQFKIKLKNLF